MTKKFEYRQIVAVVFVLGLFMDLLDMTITNVALPTLGREFNASTTTIEWVVTGYLLSLAAFIPVSGWAGDRFGTKRTFVFALTVFTAGSALCGLAWNTESLVFARLLQGAGGGMLTPVGTTMVLRAFPAAERAVVMSILAIPAVLGPALGPVIGGYFVEYQSWRWIFFINLPIGIVALAIATLFLREEKQADPGALDLPGFALSASGLAGVIYALSQAGPRGFDDPRVFVTGLAGLVALGAFTLLELNTRRPLIDVRLFKDQLFSVTNAVQFLSYARFQGSIFLMTLFLQSERGLSPLNSGLTTFPIALGVIVMMPFAGRAYRKLGPRRVLVAGLLGGAAASSAMLTVDLETSRWLIRGLMLVWGMAFALAIVPLQTAPFANIASESMGRASAAYNSVRQVGGSFGVALLATVLSNRLGEHGAVLGAPADRAGSVIAFHDAFLVAAAVALVAAVIAVFVDDRLAAGTFRASEPVATEPLREEALVA